MKAKMHGDVPEQHKLAADEIEEFEKWVYSDLTIQNVSVEDRAQILVCMAHDWMQMGMDEECERLLRDASRLCPHYFSQVLHRQVRDNYDFALVVYNLRSMLAAGLLLALGIK